MNEVPERIVQLIKKLQAMVDRGTVHESENAAQRLAEIIRRYNINLADFEENKPVWREYDVMLKHQTLFWQLVYVTVPDYDGRYRRYTNERRKFKIYLTEEQHMQVTFLFDYYVRDYDRQLKNFTKAYIIGNDLTLPADPNKPSKPMTEDDYLAVMMSLGIKKIIKPSHMITTAALPQ